MRFVVDTNVLISLVTDRDRQQRDRAEALFRSAAAGEATILVPQCVLFEFFFVLRNLYERDESAINELLVDLTAMPGVAVVGDLNPDEWLRSWPVRFDSPIDAAVAVVADRTKSRVATFDRKFGRRLSRTGIETW